MRFLFPGVENRVENVAFFLVRCSILKALWICVTSYRTKGSFSSNPIAWKRARIRKAFLSCSWTPFNAMITVETKEKGLPNLLK